MTDFTGATATLNMQRKLSPIYMSQLPYTKHTFI